MTKDENSDDVSLWDVNLVCKECGWTGISKNTEAHIRDNDKQVLMVCPRCKAIDNFEAQPL